MRRLLCVVATVALSPALTGQAPDVGSGVCVANCGSAPASNSGSGANSAYSSFQAGFQLGQLLHQLLFPAADPAAQARQQQMMLELRRRQQEAELLHKQQEAQQLQDIYNRLSATLKLEGLPHLELKLSDSASGYGIPGLPGLYTGGPRTESFSAPPIQGGGGGLQLKLGDSSATSPSSPAPFDPSTIDPKNMTPKQAADLMEYISKLPPDAQQRLLAAAQANPTASSPAPEPSPTQPADATQQPVQAAATGQGPASVEPLQAAAPANASMQPQPESPASAPTPEAASANARAGFESAAGSSVAPINSTNAAPALPRAPGKTDDVYPSAPSGSVAAPAAVPDSDIKFLFPDANAAGSFQSPFPNNPNMPLNNPLRLDEEQQAEMKSWDNWAQNQALSVGLPSYITDVFRKTMQQFDRDDVQKYAPELLARYDSDPAFRKSVDERIEATYSIAALDYYQLQADAHKAALDEYRTGLDKLMAAGKLDRLTPLGEQLSDPEKRKILQSLWDDTSAFESKALDQARAQGQLRIDREYGYMFQLIRNGELTP
jgi:hypothetical protein